MTTRRLVFGDDGSASADVVWLWINNHRWPGWTISVVCARPPREYAVLPPERVALHPWHPVHPRELFADSEATRVEYLTAEADPRVVLDSVGDAALLAIGPRGKGALKQLHIGSTTEWLLARPTVPVAVIRSGRRTERVALATDGSRHALGAARALAALPWLADTEVLVLAVADGRVDTGRAIDEASAVLRAAGADPTAVELDAESRGPLLRRDARSVLLSELAEREVDLVAVGSGDVGGFRRAFLGSTASAVALHAPCSVLVAYAEGAA